MSGSRAALHEHLGTNTYQGRKWKFDEVVDRAKKKLGPNGILVVSGFSTDKKLKTDGRYEMLTRQKSKYSRKDLDGRATLVLDDTDILVVSGLEAEIGEGEERGSILVAGIQEDTGLEAGPEVSHDDLLSQIPQDAFSFYVHPFFVGGSGPFLEKSLREGTLDTYLKPIDGIEVFNAQACLPVPGYLNANNRALDFYAATYCNSRKLVPFKSSDGHSLWELANVSTILPYQINLAGLNSWTDAYESIQVRFEVIGENPDYEGLAGTAREKLSGILGATKHSLALTVGRKLRIPNKKNW